jgi:hypothetical protein
LHDLKKSSLGNLGEEPSDQSLVCAESELNLSAAYVRNRSTAIAMEAENVSMWGLNKRMLRSLLFQVYCTTFDGIQIKELQDTIYPF